MEGKGEGEGEGEGKVEGEWEVEKWRERGGTSCLEHLLQSVLMAITKEASESVRFHHSGHTLSETKTTCPLPLPQHTHKLD